MNANTRIDLHSKWLPLGTCFVWGTSGKYQSSYDAFDLKQLLFAKHASSYYGTFIDVTDMERKEGIMVSAAWALDLFSQPPFNPEIKWTWNEHWDNLFKLAPRIQTAIEENKIVPDWEQWQKGLLMWKLPFDEFELQQLFTIPHLNDWITGIMEGRLADANTPAAKWLHRATSRTSAFPEWMEPLWTDEKEWLMSIGWIPDDKPFVPGLRLAEPEEGQLWSLHVVLVDRQKPDRSFVLGEDPLPIEWSLHQERLAADYTRWEAIAPEIMDSNGRVKRCLSYAEAWIFLTESSLRLAELGYPVLLPAWWSELRKTRPRLRAKVRSAGVSSKTSFLGIQQIMKFDWKLALGDLDLNEEEFRQIAEESRRLVHIRGRWVLLDEAFLAQLRQIMNKVKKKKGLSIGDLLEMHLTGHSMDINPMDYTPGDELLSPEIEVELTEALSDMFRLLQHNGSIPRMHPPETLTGSLRPYQLLGSSWLLFLRQAGLGGCLADDMGLGKTIQFITYLLAIQENNIGLSASLATPSLLICPTSVLGNWQKELQRFASALSVKLHYGAARAKGDAFAPSIAGYDLVITSYALSHLDAEELGALQWNSICLDEAQNIKNAYTKQAQAIRKLQGIHRIALTGTPIENRLAELWSIYDFLNPGYLGSLKTFQRSFVNPLEKVIEQEPLERVRRLIRPFMLRRVKTDPTIELDLPDKLESHEYVSLTLEQGTLYENMIQQLFERLNKAVGMERRGLILGALTKLKQLCDHPALYLKDNNSDINRSQKTIRLLEMVKDVREEGDSCLIFTQYVDMGRMLQTHLEHELSETVRFLHGGTSKASRDEMIEEFQAAGKQDPKVFILSLKAGGLGLNLTSANHVFHYDRWWNPAVENQATDRAHRIGQVKKVQVHKFVTLGTLEEKIAEMLERKTGLSEQIVGRGESWITELSGNDLKEVFMLRSEWVR